MGRCHTKVKESHMSPYDKLADFLSTDVVDFLLQYAAVSCLILSAFGVVMLVLTIRGMMKKGE